MEKNVTLINPKGKSIQVSEHMVSDMLKMGCTQKVPQKKDAPEELLRPIKLPPAKVITPEPVKETLPLMESSVAEPVNQEPEKPKRRSPVRSKSTK